MITDSYETFKQNYLRLAGIDLSAYKEGQMKRRIDTFIKKQKVTTYNEFLQLLKRDEDVYDRFITYLTINVSEFYRNPLQWKMLKEKIIPLLLERYGRPLKIWSAACSTGDEPYSLAMVLSDFLPLEQFRIIATDLDEEVLAKARKGYYNDKSIRGLPKQYQDKFLDIDDTGVVKVKDKLKSCVTFEQQNLLSDRYPQGIHLIVCRNVLIYFTEEAKGEIYTKFARSLVNRGILFVGSTEQIISSEQYGFKGIQSFFYEKM